MNARLFEELRPIGFAVAYRMLGSVSEAEDIVQEAFLRLHYMLQDGKRIESPRAYLSTVVTRLCINHLRSARARRETYVEALAGSLSLAFLVLLETLSPEQRAAFLLREVSVNGQPGAMVLDPSERLIGVVALDIAEGGQIQAVTSVVNPDKLRHLGPLADLVLLSGRGRRGRQEPLPGTSSRHHTGG